MNYHKVEHGFLCGFTTGDSFEFIVNGLDGAEGETITFKLSEDEYHLNLAESVARNLTSYVKDRREGKERRRREQEEKERQERVRAQEQKDLVTARNIAHAGLTPYQKDILNKYGWDKPKSDIPF